MWRNSSIGIIWNTLWEYAKGYRHFLILLIVFQTLGNAIDLINPYVIGQIINTLQLEGVKGVPSAFTLVYILISVRIINIIFGNIGVAIEKKLMRITSHSFLKDFYKKSQSLPLLWHQDTHSGDMVSRLNKANNALGTFAGAPGQMIWMGLGFFGPAFILLKIMPAVGIFVCAVCLITIIVSFSFDKKIKKYGTITNNIYHKVMAALNDYLGNIRTIIILHLGSQTQNDIQKRLKETIPSFNAEMRMKLGRWITTETLMEATVILALMYILSSLEKGNQTLQIGNIVMVITYLRQMSTSVFTSSRFYSNLVQGIIDYKGTDIINNAYADHCKKHTVNEHEIENWKNISVQNLSFTYPLQNTISLNDLSFKITAGQKIALVGASGGGKSTLMSLLRGLYPAQQGSTDIDGMIYPTIEPLASISTLIPQDPEIFENTIRYNITLGVEHSDEEIMEACRIACFDTIIDELPNGLDSKINEKGVNLSGGQKQRLALARGIFAIQDSSLVLFDEPTSSVDSMTERLMYKNLFEAFPQICLISSIHRLNLLNQFDTLWVMQKGQMVQQGSLQELLNQPDKPFLKLWTAYQNEEPA